MTAHHVAPLADVAVQLVRTKLGVPPLPDSMLSRHRVNGLLTRAHRRSITLVAAPAGFGKTIAVADWVHRHPETDRFVWLTAETEDDEPRRFWPGLVEAVATIEPTALADIRHKLSTGSVLKGSSLASELVNSLCSIQQPITVVIDNFEKITHPDVMRWFTFLVRSMSATVRLLLCTRSEPELPLWTWRAKGRLSEITKEHLQFTGQEAGAYLDPLIAGAISREQEAALFERTQGWITALHLAALGIQRACDPTVFIDSFDGSHNTISDYIVHDVLAYLPAGMRSFLLETSITRTMSASVCDAITNRTDSAAMLRALVKHGIFVTAEHSGGRWSYHPLLREALRALLTEAADKTDLADLHERAVRSYLDEADYASALEHAVAANNPVLTRKIVEDHHRGLLLTNPEALLATLATFPEDSLAAWPQGRSIQLAAAAVLADTDTLQAIAGREAIGGARTFELVAGNVLSYLDGDYVRLGKMLPQSARGMHPVARAALRGLIETADEQYESGAAVLRSAATSHPTDHFTAVATTGILAWNRVCAGYLNIGTAYARRALSFADTEGTRWIHWVRWAELAQAQAKYDRGQVHEALSESTSIVEAEPRDRRSHVEAHLLAARINWALGNRDAASEHLATAADGRGGPTSGPLADIIALTNAQICLLDGDTELAAAWLPDWRTRAAAGPTGERERLVVARLLIESERFEESLDLLQRAGPGSPPSIRYLVETEKLKAIAASRSGDSSAPMLLEVAHATAETEGLVQTFVDDWRTLAQIGRPSDIATLGPVATSKGSESTSPRAAGNSRLVEPLTERELAVLHLLPTRMTNQEIAQELFISINTAKTHLKAIYRKLGVNNRNGAVEAAVSMRLV